MKPNDKAIEAGVKLCWDCPRATPSMIRDILTAAYAAQFPPSEDYAGLVKKLRERARYDGWATEDVFSGEAADALEAVLAERDALKAENEKLREALKPFAAEFSLYKTDFPDHFYISDLGFTFGQLRAAAAALEGVTEQSAGENNGK